MYQLSQGKYLLSAYLRRLAPKETRGEKNPPTGFTLSFPILMGAPAMRLTANLEIV